MFKLFRTLIVGWCFMTITSVIASEKNMENNHVVNINIKQRWFNYIQSGEKTVEGRIAKGFVAKLKVGDTINFLSKDSNDNDIQISKRVIYLNKYKSFKDMLTNEGLENCLPRFNSIDDGVRLYHSFPGYRENERNHGVMAIGLAD